MVAKGRLFWRWVALGFVATLFFSGFARLRGVQPWVEATGPKREFRFRPPSAALQSTTSQPKKSPPKKTTKRARPKPAKPVPLTPIDPVPIEDGEGRPLETFFRALADLESAKGDAPDPPVVRIIHFGDSHVASDYWAGVIREKLQARFGDAGPGFVLPGRPWNTIRYAQAKSLDGQYWRTDGLRLGENDGVVGLGGMSIENYRQGYPASAEAVFSQFQILAAAAPGATCLQVQLDGVAFPDIASHSDPVIAAAVSTDSQLPEPNSRPPGVGPSPGPPDPPEPPVTQVRSKKKKARRKAVPAVPPFKPWPPSSPLDLLEIDNSSQLSAGLHKVSVLSDCGGTARLLGMEFLNGSKGIIYDTDGVNGARLADLEKPLPELRRALLHQSNPTLIIVSYGTNDIGTKGFTASDYEEHAYQILSKLKMDAGNASILVTGPTDRGSPYKRTRTFMQAAQAQLQPALRRAALRAGCAYWDQQAAMGGAGSMLRWVRAGLASYDFVHFSGLGYSKLAGMLYDQLMNDYAKFLQAESPK